MRLASTFTAIAVLTNAPVFANGVDDATRLPQPPSPARTTLEWIARNMKMNGLPMTLRSFDSSLAPSELLEHYAHWWSTTDAGARGTTQVVRQGVWQVLALASPGLLVTVRAEPRRSGSHGTIAVSPNPSLVEMSTRTSFPHPADSHVLNLQQYNDPGTTAEYISLATSRSVAIAVHEFTQHLIRYGWSVYRDQRSQSFASGHVLEAQNGSDVAQLTFVPAEHSGSRIIVIWRKG